MPNMKDILKYAIKNLIDNLNRFIILIFIILSIITIFIRTFILDIIKVILLAIFIYRLVSKNKTKRYYENEKYLKIKNKLIHPFKEINDRITSQSIYKKCHNCKTVLKLPLPKKAGINHAKCPSCGKRLTILNIRHQKKEKVKVEVIKKRG